LGFKSVELTVHASVAFWNRAKVRFCHDLIRRDRPIGAGPFPSICADRGHKNFSHRQVVIYEMLTSDEAVPHFLGRAFQFSPFMIRRM
jgi:hypothetical protein